MKIQLTIEQNALELCGSMCIRCFSIMHNLPSVLGEYTSRLWIQSASGGNFHPQLNLWLETRVY